MSGSMTQVPPAAAHRIEELGRIIMAYSEVTEKLQQSHDQLTQTVQKLREELSEKNRLLERRNRLAALGEMAAGMAHEIRNPLGGIQLYASMLAQDLAGRPELLAIVRKISGGVKHLEDLVSQALQFTREIRINPSPADLANLVEQAADLVRSEYAQQSIEVVVEGPESLPVQVDALMVHQVLLNLLLNAAQAMDGTGRINVRYDTCEEQPRRQFRLIVQDDGPGICEEILDRIFNPFFTTRDTGTGLGLAIVHRVIEAHDGTVTASSPPGEGARFEVVI
jgi:signal transduction histidine kinase